MRDFDLIAFDLDGTVYGNPATQILSDRVKDAFAAAHDAGVVIAVSTGRASWMLGPELPKMDWLDYGVVSNGGMVVRLHPVDHPDCAHPHFRGIRRNVLVPYLAALADEGAVIRLQTQDHVYMDEATKELFLEHARLAAKAEGKDPIEATRENPINKIVGPDVVTYMPSVVKRLAEDESMEVCKVDLTLANQDSYDHAVSLAAEMGGMEVAEVGGLDLEISAEGATKGSGVGWLCEHLGIPEERAVAFGDSGNDLSLTGRALHFVAMGNATDEIKAAADDATGSVYEDGVAQWIESHL